MNLPENISKQQIQDILARAEELARELPTNQQVEPPIAHYFSKGVYAREMKMNAGEVVVGKIHKYENLCIISEGELSIISIDGIQRIKAPYTFVGSPGAKRLIWAHTDVVWTVIHGTDLTDVEKIEEEFIAKDYSEVPQIQIADVIQITEKIA